MGNLILDVQGHHLVKSVSVCGVSLPDLGGETLEVHQEPIDVVVFPHLELSKLVLHVHNSVEWPESLGEDLHELVVVHVPVQRVVVVKVQQLWFEP